jgi:hypothetical protein
MSKSPSACAGLLAERLYSAVAQPRGVALAVLGELHDEPGDRRRHRIGAIDRSQLAQGSLKCRRQICDVLWLERVVVFEDESERHVETSEAGNGEMHFHAVQRRRQATTAGPDPRMLER